MFCISRYFWDWHHNHGLGRCFVKLSDLFLFLQLKVVCFFHASFLRPAKQCPLGLQYMECISCCPASCNLERTCIDSKLACLDGCYCPDGESETDFCLDPILNILSHSINELSVFASVPCLLLKWILLDRHERQIILQQFCFPISNFRWY